MIILAIETSGDIGSVAVCEDECPLASHEFPEGARHARNIMPAVDRVLADARIDRRAVDAVAVADGPGSFTGLRVGVTCAKTLAWTLGWKCAGIPTLEVLVQNVPAEAAEQVGFASPVLDARRGAVYGDVFRWTGAEWEDTTGVLVREPEALAEELPEGTLVFGTGATAYPEVFAPPRCTTGDGMWACGRAEAVARLGLRRIREDGGVDPMQLVPRYYRPTACEEELETQSRDGA